MQGPYNLASRILVNIGSGNGLVPSGTKPLPEPMLIHYQLPLDLNPLRANFYRENINIYLHFVSFLHIDTTQVVEILPQIIQEPTYFT